MDDVFKEEHETTLRLEDLEKIKFDLNEEKSVIRKKEIKLSKIQRILRQKELQLDEHKHDLHRRKECNDSQPLKQNNFESC